jgi:hypothetical protein
MNRGSRVYAVGFRVWGLECRVLDSGFWVLGRLQVALRLSERLRRHPHLLRQPAAGVGSRPKIYAFML